MRIKYALLMTCLILFSAVSGFAADPYDVLGIPRNSTFEEAQAAYRRLVKTVHPDRLETGNENRLKEVIAAYRWIQNNNRNPSTQKRNSVKDIFFMSEQEVVDNTLSRGKKIPPHYQQQTEEEKNHPPALTTFARAQIQSKLRETIENAQRSIGLNPAIRPLDGSTFIYYSLSGLPSDFANMAYYLYEGGPTFTVIIKYAWRFYQFEVTVEDGVVLDPTLEEGRGMNLDQCKRALLPGAFAFF